MILILLQCRDSINTNGVKDFDPIWLDDYLDEFIIPRINNNNNNKSNGNGMLYNIFI
jgi:hypothetical protein